MNNLDIYDLYGFKFFLCKADKSPDTPGNWMNKNHHITKDQAEQYQKTGRMIGAWIPENVIVIDLDRHEGKPDGVKVMEGIKEKYNITYSITDNNFLVKTAGKGFHIFFTTDKKWGQKSNIAESIDIKTNKGYVIAAGSPGYEIIYDNEPMELPFELEQWLIDCQKEKKKPEKKDKKKSGNEKKYLPPKSLKRILNKIKPENFNQNDRWLEFVMSCLAVAGNINSTHEIIDSWSKEDPNYSDDRSVIKRIESFKEVRDITAGSFVHFLREQNISQYIINQVVKLDSISTAIIEAENSEIDLPFPDPDYAKLSISPAAQEFYHMTGNTAAATLIESATLGFVLWDHSTKANYYFDGNRWLKFYDYYGIVYTIIYRVVKIIYQKTEGEKEDNDRLYKCVSAINTTGWKDMTWKEFTKKPRVHHEYVLWDSPKITETITLNDGVIDFRDNEIKSRTGEKDEFRLSYFDYTIDEIMGSKKPKIFMKFFDDLFLDEKTRETAKYCIAMSISGNSGKRLFQMWKGIGSNGKSTLLETISKVLGKDKSYKYPSEILLTGNRHENYKSEMAKFRGKYFCYTSEADKGARLSQNAVKNITGDEIIQGKALYENPIEFDATWQLIYAVNDLPSFHGEDYAFNDRLLVIPFNTVFWKNNEKKLDALMRGVDKKHLVKADSSRGFKESLYSEKAAIIMWMIKNYIELNTKKNGVIPESPECILHKTKYIEDNDETGVFIHQLCEIDVSGEKEWYSIPDDLIEAYRDFTGLKKKGERTIIKEIANSHTSIKKEVIRINIQMDYGKKKKQVRVLRNVILKDNIDSFVTLKDQSKKENQDQYDKENNDSDEIPFS